MIGLTAQQAHCLRLIAEHWRDHGRSPKPSYLAPLMALSNSRIHYIIKALAERGRVKIVQYSGSTYAKSVEVVSSFDGQALRFIPVHTAPNSRTEQPDHA